MEFKAVIRETAESHEARSGSDSERRLAVLQFILMNRMTQSLIVFTFEVYIDIGSRIKVKTTSEAKS